MTRSTLQRRILPASFLLVLSALPPASSLSAASGTLSQSAHGDPVKLPRGCGSCHVGHGEPGTPMLSDRQEPVCCNCHGDESAASQARQEKRLAGWVRLENVCREFDKPHHHPVENTGIHQLGEILPEQDPSQPRHSECQDCHQPHQAQTLGRELSPKGIAKKTVHFKDLTYEYQLCYRCHSYSANLPSSERNKQHEFDQANPSYHPVEVRGKNPDVPSLLSPYTTASVINCTDCHGNNDTGGPRGPHGSMYESILVRNYHRSDGLPESRSGYELCYECHDRGSILSDESFPWHRRHTADQRISCYSCHDSHGSQAYNHLIRFEKDPRYRQAEPLPPDGVNGGKMEFIDRGRLSGECYLRCHGINHNPRRY